MLLAVVQVRLVEVFTSPLLLRRLLVRSPWNSRPIGLWRHVVRSLTIGRLFYLRTADRPDWGLRLVIPAAGIGRLQPVTGGMVISLWPSIA